MILSTEGIDVLININIRKCLAYDITHAGEFVIPFFVGHFMRIQYAYSLLWQRLGCVLYSSLTTSLRLFNYGIHLSFLCFLIIYHKSRNPQIAVSHGTHETSGTYGAAALMACTSRPMSPISPKCLSGHNHRQSSGEATPFSGLIPRGFRQPLLWQGGLIRRQPPCPVPSAQPTEKMQPFKSPRRREDPLRGTRRRGGLG